MNAERAPSDEVATLSLDDLNAFFEREHIVALYEYVRYADALPKGIPATAAWLGQIPIEHPERAVSELSALFESVREHAAQGTVIIKDIRNMAGHFAEMSAAVNSRSQKIVQAAQALCALDTDDTWEAVLAAPPSPVEKKHTENLTGFIEDLQDIQERIAIYQFVLDHEAGLLQRFFSMLSEDLIPSAENSRRAISRGLQGPQGDGLRLRVEDYAQQLAQAKKAYSAAVRQMFEISNGIEVSFSSSCMERAVSARKEIDRVLESKREVEQQLATQSSMEGDLLKLSAFFNTLTFNLENIFTVFNHVDTFCRGLSAHTTEMTVKLKNLQSNHDVALSIISFNSLMYYWDFISGASQKAIFIFSKADPAASA